MITRNVLIRLIDEVNCLIVGLTDKDTEYFKKLYSPYAENYFFSKKYKLGQWDGRISFFSKGGKTYIKLLDEIIPELKARGYKLSLKDDRQQLSLNLPTITKDYMSDALIELGPHQVEAVNAITKNNGGIVLAATGAGKSIINACLAKLYNDFYQLKVIVIVPNSDLVTQGVEDFANLGLDVGEYSGDVKDINHEIVISTWQALQNNPELIGMFNVAIVDECHGVKGKVLKELLNEYGAHLYVKIGVTGTLPESEVDRMSVKVTLGVPEYTITAKQLIDLGWLSELDIYILELEEDKKDEYESWKKQFPDEAEKVSYKEYLNTMFPDYASEKKYLNLNKKRLEYICKMVNIQKMKDKGNTLILVNSVQMGQKMQELIEGSYFVYSPDKKEFRRNIYSLFKDNDDIVVIATSQLASTGLNIPRIFNLFLIDIGKSYIRVIQSIGRGLRKAHDKNYVSIFDISSNLRYSKDHQNKRIVHYKKAQYPYTKQKIKYTQ